MISVYQNQMMDSQALSDLTAGIVYEIPEPHDQYEPIGQHKASGYPPLEEWEQGFGG